MLFLYIILYAYTDHEAVANVKKNERKNSQEIVLNAEDHIFVVLTGIELEIPLLDVADILGAYRVRCNEKVIVHSYKSKGKK